MPRFFQELRRRSVYTVGATYVVVAWLLLQAADLVLPIYNAPEWILPVFATFLFLGFPVALILAWAYEITPKGVKRTDEPSNVISQNTSNDVLDLPPGPSIAVLPFSNFSADTDQELFAQAMTNDIITGLTQCSALRVVSTGVATPDDGDANPITAGRDLGVRYLLQGSVNRASEQLRVTAQLTDTKTSEQTWSANYDQELTATNLFAVQDDIREQIVATLSDLHGVIYSSETEKNIHRPTENLNAYECLSVALAYDKYLSEEYHLRARDSLEKALVLDPEFDQAWSHLSWIYTDEVVFGYNSLPNSMERALKVARRGVELAPTNYNNHWLLARVHYFNGEKTLFFAEAEKSLSLNSNDGTVLGLIGAYTLLAGEWERGVALVEKAKILNPNHPDYYHLFLSAADFHNIDYAEALKKLRKMSFLEWPPAWVFLISASSLTGNMEEATRYYEALKDLLGDVTPKDARDYLTKLIPYADDVVATVMSGLEPVMTPKPTEQ
jgi:adenylate cyclase